jgi:hypothetical protein
MKSPLVPTFGPLYVPRESFHYLTPATAESRKVPRAGEHRRRLGMGQRSGRLMGWDVGSGVGREGGGGKYWFVSKQMAPGVDNSGLDKESCSMLMADTIILQLLFSFFSIYSIHPRAPSSPQMRDFT